MPTRKPASQLRFVKSACSDARGRRMLSGGSPDAASCCVKNAQFSAKADASARARPVAISSSRPVAAGERQIGLGRERRDADARQVAAPLVDDEAPLPAGQELAVEDEQVVEL